MGIGVGGPLFFWIGGSKILPIPGGFASCQFLKCLGKTARSKPLKGMHPVADLPKNAACQNPPPGFANDLLKTFIPEGEY
jgi:hypothetical protein